MLTNIEPTARNILFETEITECDKNEKSSRGNEVYQILNWKLDDSFLSILEDNVLTGTIAEGNRITRNMYQISSVVLEILVEINTASEMLEDIDLDISGAMKQPKQSQAYSLTGQMRDFKGV